MSAETVFSIEGVDIHYGSFQAVRDISLTVKKGEIVSLVGANGAGKSTILQAASGLIKPTCGIIQYHGQNLVGLDPSEIVAAGISHVPQGRQLFPDMSVLDNLMLGSYTRKARTKKDQNLRLVYDLFPILEERKQQRANTFSGGEQQMLALGRGLMANPTMMFLDEMSLGLAPIIISKIYAILQEIKKQGITILFVEQSVRRSLKESDRAYIMEAGRVVMEGSAEDLQEEDKIKKAYFGC